MTIVFCVLVLVELWCTTVDAGRQYGVFDGAGLRLVVLGRHRGRLLPRNNEALPAKTILLPRSGEIETRLKRRSLAACRKNLLDFVASHISSERQNIAPLVVKQKVPENDRSTFGLVGLWI